MPVQRFAASLPGIAGAVRGALKKADQALGGWLPGGGVASPATRAVQRVLPSRKAVAEAVRDQVVVPVLDGGIGAGVLPTKEAMFARYLTGTAKPLTVYPEQQKQAIRDAYERLAMEDTREQVDKIFKSENPLYREYSNTRSELNRLQGLLRDRAELGKGEPTPDEQTMLKRLESTQAALKKRLGISELDAAAGSVKVGDDQRLDIIRRHGLSKPEEFTVNYQGAYGGSTSSGALPEEVQLTLGRFNVRDGEIRDRYKFDSLGDGRTYRIPDGDMVYPDAAGGGKTASDLIELGLRSGVINPGSGYDIRVPLGR